MSFTTLKVPGPAAIETLESRRRAYPQSGEYPFLIGDANELERVREAAEYNKQDVEELVRESLSLDLSSWLAERREEAEEFEFSEDDALGKWPGEVSEKGAISHHLDYSVARSRKKSFLVWPGSSSRGNCQPC